MADVRTDNLIGAVEIRTDDYQEIKSIELFPEMFRVNDATQEVEFANDESRDDLMRGLSAAILAMATHELTGRPRPGAAS